MLTKQGRMLTAAQARIADLEAEITGLRMRLGHIIALAQGVPGEASRPAPHSRANRHAISLEQQPEPTSLQPFYTPRAAGVAISGTPVPSGTERPPGGPVESGSTLHPAARKLLAALAQHAPARFTWGQAATLAGLKAAGGHYNAGRKQLRDLGLVEEAGDLVAASPAGLDAAGEVPSAPSTPGERLALWCERLPSPAPEMLRSLASHGGRYTEAADLAAALGKKPTGGHWNSGLALLRNNGLVEVSGKRLRVSELFR